MNYLSYLRRERNQSLNLPILLNPWPRRSHHLFHQKQSFLPNYFLLLMSLHSIQTIRLKNSLRSQRIHWCPWRQYSPQRLSHRQ